jgi:hypothetical protein
VAHRQTTATGHARARGCEHELRGAKTTTMHKTEERERVDEAPAMRGCERRPWRRGGGDAQMGLTPGENGGKGASTRRRKARWSCAQGESGNGGAVAEHDAGGWRNGMRRRELPLGFFKIEREREGGSGVEEQGGSSGEQPVRRGRGAGPAGAPAAAVAGAWRPRGGCPLPRSGTGARAGA